MGYLDLCQTNQCYLGLLMESAFWRHTSYLEKGWKSQNEEEKKRENLHSLIKLI